MIIRIVKMTFQEEKIADFLSVFDASKTMIRNMPGCSKLELLRDINSPNIFFTYSYWENESDLENYRKSELFAGVWAKTKILFMAKAEAWSVDRSVSL